MKREEGLIPCLQALTFELHASPRVCSFIVRSGVTPRHRVVSTCTDAQVYVSFLLGSSVLLELIAPHGNDASCSLRARPFHEIKPRGGRGSCVVDLPNGFSAELEFQLACVHLGARVCACVSPELPGC